MSKFRLKELLRYDLASVKILGVFVIASLVHILKCMGSHRRVIASVGRLFNSGWRFSDAIATKWIRKYLFNQKLKRELRTLMVTHIETIAPLEKARKFFERPEHYFPHICTVLKQKRNQEKGVILLNYSYYFPLFAKLFDINKVARDYYIVLEPSWAGFFDKDILCYLNVDAPVFLEAAEPRDYRFIEKLESNIIPVSIGANWWIDSRTFRPISNVNKDIDIIMVSAWAEYKRHYSVFSTIRNLRKKNIRLKVALLGHKLDFDGMFIQELAKAYGIFEQIEIYEALNQEEVNVHFNRSKINLLWSRFEGFNRSIIEGMYANVPCIMRSDFNYGYKYPYINDLTGVFAKESDLEQKILDILARQQDFTPRKWVEENMSAGSAIQLLGEKIKIEARRNGEIWSEGLVKKVNALNGTYYWDESDYQKFQQDYDDLKRLVRKN